MSIINVCGFLREWISIKTVAVNCVLCLLKRLCRRRRYFFEGAGPDDGRFGTLAPLGLSRIKKLTK